MKFLRLNLEQPDKLYEDRLQTFDHRTLDQLKGEDLVAFNSEAEQAFVELVCELVHQERLTTAQIIQEASFELNISPLTARRYLIKHTARRARFQIENKLVVCKVHRGIR